MNKRIHCLVIVLVCLGTFKSQAQKTYFNKLYNNNSLWDQSFGIINLGKHYLSAGYTIDVLANDSTNLGAIWLFYLDSVGNKGIESIIRIANQPVYRGLQHVITRTFDNNFIYYAGLGNINNQNNYCTILIKLDSLLQPIWQTIDTGKGYSDPAELIQTPDSGFWVCGFGAINYQTQKDGFISRFDKNGYKLWTKYYGDSRDEFLVNLVYDNNNTLLVSGTADGFPFLMNVDTSGNLVWRKFFNTYTKTSLFIKKSQYDSSLIAYGTQYSDPFIDYYGVVARINENAEFIWKDSIRRGNHFSCFNDLIELPGGNIITMGRTDNTKSISATTVGWLAKFYKDGGVIGEKVFEKENGVPSDLSDMAFTGDYGVVCAGMTVNDYDTPPRGQDVWIVKLDTNLCDTPNCSPGVGMKDITEGNELAVYPNPCTIEITIRYGNTIFLSGMAIKIYNAQGVLIKNIQLEKSAQSKVLSTDSFAPGLYIVQLIQNGAIVKTQRLLKQL